MKILIIEDDVRLNSMLKSYFKDKGHKVVSSYDGEDGLNLYFNSSPDIVITDWLLPKLSGIELCKAIKNEGTTPIVILTANSAMEDELIGLLSGADDYVTKPFNLKVLETRVNNLLNRNKSNKIKISKDAEIILEDMIVKTSEKKIPLSLKEYNLFLFLYENSGYSSKDKILNHVWGYDYYGDPRTVDTHITRLRKK